MHTFDDHLIRFPDSLPAGGESIGGPAFIFVLLLVTYILGLTKAHSFTRSVK